MSYFKIGDRDYSPYVNQLFVSHDIRYDALINANGDTVVDYINTKRILDVGFIPLDDEAMRQLQIDVKQFHMLVSFRNPETGELEEVDCIVPVNEVDYYTIQRNRVLYKPFTLQFVEL